VSVSSNHAKLENRVNINLAKPSEVSGNSYATTCARPANTTARTNGSYNRSRRSCNSSKDTHIKSSANSNNNSVLRQRQALNSNANFGPEAIIQDDSEIIEEVELDLNKILTEEQVIYSIFESIKDKSKSFPHLKTWWVE